tara:strand:+ start:144 stop:1178 length:1035 start_codon:yes stop_codon:yes gene_type:complete
MKITKNQLRQIIQEAIATSLNENIPPGRTVSSVPTEVVPPPEDENVRRSQLGDVSGTGERAGGPNPWSLGSAYDAKQRAELKPPTDLPGGVRLGAMEKVIDSDKGSLEVGGSIKTGPTENVNDFLSNIQVGAKGKLPNLIGSPINPFATVDFTFDPNSKSGRESFGKIQTALGAGVGIDFLGLPDMIELGLAKRIGGTASSKIAVNAGPMQVYTHLVQSGEGLTKPDSSGGVTIDVPKMGKAMRNFFNRLKRGKQSTAIPAHLRPPDDSNVAYEDVPAETTELSTTDKIKTMPDKDWKNLLKSGDLSDEKLAYYRKVRDAHREGSGGGDVVNETFKRWKELING